MDRKLGGLIAVVAALTVGEAIGSDSRTTFLGVELGAPLSMPECPFKLYGKKDDYGIYSEFYTTGAKALKAPCWKHLTAGKTPGTPIDPNGVTVELYLERPRFIDGERITAKIVNGNVELIRALTFGVESQEAALAALTEKFGKPTAMAKKESQNRMGASFLIIEAAWVLDGMRAILVGAAGRIDAGGITVSTAIGDAYETAEREKERAASPKL